jgi:anti-sigma factor RsiW
MRCSRIRSLLSPFHDGELGRSETEEVKAHLIGCSRCRAAASDLSGLSRLFDPDEPIPQASAGFTDAVLARLRAGEGLVEARAERLARRIAWAAAALLTLSAGYLAMPRSAAPGGLDTLDAASAREVDDEIRRNDAGPAATLPAALVR